MDEMYAAAVQSLMALLTGIPEDASVDQILAVLQKGLPASWTEGFELLVPGGPLHELLTLSPDEFTNITVGIVPFAPHQPCTACLDSEEGQTLAAVMKAKLCTGCKYLWFHTGCQAEAWPHHKPFCKKLRKKAALADGLRRLERESGVFTDGVRWYSKTGRCSDIVYKTIQMWHQARQLEREYDAKGRTPPVRPGPCPVSKKTAFEAEAARRLPKDAPLRFTLNQPYTDAHSSRGAFYFLQPSAAASLVAWLAAKGCTRFHEPAAGNGLFAFMLEHFGGVSAEAIRCTDLSPGGGYFPVEQADACDPAQYDGVDWEKTVLVLLWPEFPGMAPYAERLIRLAYAMGVRHILLGAEEPGCAMSPEAHAALDELYPKEEAIPGVPDFAACALTLAQLAFISGDRPEHVRHAPLAYATDPSFRRVNQKLRLHTRA